MDCHMAAEGRIDFRPKNRNIRIGLAIRAFSKLAVIKDVQMLTMLSLNHPQLEQPGQRDLGQELEQ